VQKPHKNLPICQKRKSHAFDVFDALFVSCYVESVWEAFPAASQKLHIVDKEEEGDAPRLTREID